MRTILSILFILFACVIQAQTKTGGYFSRIDDPYPLLSGQGGHAKEARTVNFADSFGIKTSFAVVCEYHVTGSESMQPTRMIYPAKRAYLKQLQDSGHTLGMHTPNHSTCYYISHYDSLSTEDQLLLANGYSQNQGVDTIIVNAHATNSLLTAYYKHLPDNHAANMYLGSITDTDEIHDSIWRKVTLPPRSVLIAIYPNAAGLKKLISEHQYRFEASGLDPSPMFIHPGNENYDISNDSAILHYGFVTTKIGRDTVVFHIQKHRSSGRPTDKYGTSTYVNALFFNGNTYNIIYSNSGVGDSIFTCRLSGYTGNGTTYSAKLKSQSQGHWMWWVDAATMREVGEELGLKTAAVYSMGIQYTPLGYNTSSMNKPLFEWAHEWYQYNSYSGTLALYKKAVAEAAIRHSFVSGDDHQFYNYSYYAGMTEADRQAFFTWINQHPNEIKKLDNVMLADSVHRKATDPYENIAPSFDVDINADNLMDGWTVGTSTWVRDSSFTFNGDTTYVTVNSTGIYCDLLYGVEKGYNLISFWARPGTVSSFTLTVNQTQYTTGGTAGQSTGFTYPTYLSTPTTKTIQLAGGWNKYNVYYNIIPRTDYIKITLNTATGTVDIGKISMSKMREP